MVLIQLMGRWGSNVVMRYCEEAPLAAITSIVKKANDMPSSISQLAKASKAAKDKMITEAPTNWKRMVEEEIKEITRWLDTLECKQMWVQNTRSGCVHRIENKEGPLQAWLTYCGGYFALYLLLPRIAAPATGGDMHTLRAQAKMDRLCATAFGE